MKRYTINRNVGTQAPMVLSKSYRWVSYKGARLDRVLFLEELDSVETLIIILQQYEFTLMGGSEHRGHIYKLEESSFMDSFVTWQDH
jgi:hypothetical protein